MKNLLENKNDTPCPICTDLCDFTGSSICGYCNNDITYMKSNEMEFIDQIAINITETNYCGGDIYEQTILLKGTEHEHTETMFTEKANDFYMEVYDEIENLYINLIKKRI